MRFYIDSFYCERCKERFILKVPYNYACSNLERFMFLVEVQDRKEREHEMCEWVMKVKEFLKYPVTVRVNHDF